MATRAAHPAHPAHCPHCLLVIADDVTHPYPRMLQRCPHCQLVIGAGRALQDGGGEDRTRGSAAGVYANAARRRGAEPGDEDEVREGLAQAADEVGCRVERLLMIDYQRLVERGVELPPLSVVLATFGSWKAARSRAADGDQAGDPIRTLK